MPGYGGRRGVPCGGRRKRGTRMLLQPSLLTLLAEGKSHGYELYDQLEELGFDIECLDSSIIYRDLREMEELGWIDSVWDDDSKGPRRRVYRLLPDGRSQLEDWIQRLGSLQGRIHSLVDRAETALKRNGAK
jgi:PadR family transcriptional regulator PadR